MLLSSDFSNATITIVFVGAVCLFFLASAYIKRAIERRLDAATERPNVAESIPRSDKQDPIVAERALASALARLVSGNDSEALADFDHAIRGGIRTPEAYEGRGTILQSLGFDLDAIDDFNEAIHQRADDCNLYFMRGLSKSAVGRYADAVVDFDVAIALSKLDNAVNRSYLATAREAGYPSIAGMYERHRQNAQRDLELDRRHSEIRARSPALKEFRSTAEKAAAKAKRRSVNDVYLSERSESDPS